MWKTVCLLALVMVVVVSLPTPDDETKKSSMVFQAVEEQEALHYDYNRDICPEAEGIIRRTVKELYEANPTTSPQLLRLVFHDCFIRGCDGSVLLNESSDGKKPEKAAPPNLTLKGFHQIDVIKARLEAACPSTVSCADTLVLAAREALVLAGGPFYPLSTGRRDSTTSHFIDATLDLPRPDDNITETIRKFSLKGFDDKDMVALLGGHHIGSIACEFIQKRIANFLASGQQDPSLPRSFLDQFNDSCSSGNATSISMGTRFDTHYYKSLLNGTGLLFSDQQLMAWPITATLVQNYASEDGGSAFHRDFASAMMKLSTLIGRSTFQGPVRLNCSKFQAPAST